MRRHLLQMLVLACALCSGAKGSADYCYDSCDPCGCDPCAKTWEGFYVSGQVGGGWNHHRWKFKNANFFNTDDEIILGNRAKFNSDGVLGGGALGYNYQCGNFVVGVEGGAWGLDLKHSRRSPFFPDTDRFSAKLDWLGFAKLRAGYAFNDFLVYASGGWAGSNLHIRLRDDDLDVVAKSNKWINGWTVGAGVEYKICNWSLGLAYDYIELESTRNPRCPDCGEGLGFGTPRIQSTSQLQALTFRINYYFNLF